MSIRICRECLHYEAVNTCKHPDLLDVVTGEPQDCYDLRAPSDVPPPEDGEVPVRCGPAGALWQPVQTP